MPLFTSRDIKIVELVAYFLATAAIGFVAGIALSVLQHWLQWGEFGVGVAIPVAVSALAGACFVGWLTMVATARRRTTTWRR